MVYISRIKKLTTNKHRCQQHDEALYVQQFKTCTDVMTFPQANILYIYIYIRSKLYIVIYIIQSISQTCLHSEFAKHIVKTFKVRDKYSTKHQKLNSLNPVVSNILRAPSSSVTPLFTCKVCSILDRRAINFGIVGIIINRFIKKVVQEVCPQMEFHKQVLAGDHYEILQDLSN